MLTKDELKALWHYVNKEYDNHIISYENRIILKFLIVFGCRLSEIILSTWDEWDLENDIWRVPLIIVKMVEKLLDPFPIILNNGYHY